MMRPTPHTGFGRLLASASFRKMIIPGLEEDLKRTIAVSGEPLTGGEPFEIIGDQVMPDRPARARSPEEAAIALECLRLAVALNLPAEAVLAAAADFYAFVTGTERADAI